MKKRTILPLLASLLLASCTDQVIDCQKITVKNYDQTIIEQSYSISTTFINEYENVDGKHIYLHGADFWGFGNPKTSYFKVYQDKYLKDYDMYTFKRKVGNLTLEQWPRYDIKKQIIDTVLKYSECKINTDTTLNNKEAFEKAKSAYFTISSDSMILPQTEKGLEHHTYTILTKNCTVAYQLLVK